MLNIHTAFDGSVWAIDRDKLAEIQAFVEGIDPNRDRTQAQREEYDAFMSERREMTDYERAGVTVADGVAHVKLHGTIMKRAGMMMRISGGTSADELRKAAKMLASDPAVRTVVLDVNSPGGSVEGVEEARQAIIALRSSKPVYAVANDVMASAAYYLASAATEVYATPSAVIGSIGVYQVRVDRSAQLKERGIKYEVIKAGEFKALGADGEPMSDEERTERQRVVNHYYDMFVDAVAANLNIPRDEALALADGRIFVGTQAVDTGMATKIKSLDDVLASAGDDAKAAEQLDALKAEYETVTSALATAETERDEFKAQIDSREKADTEAKVNDFVAVLQTQGKIGAEATDDQIAALKANLTADFDGTKAMWDLVPAKQEEKEQAPTKAALPTPITPVAPQAKADADESKADVAVARDDAQAKIFADMEIPFTRDEA